MSEPAPNLLHDEQPLVDERAAAIEELIEKSDLAGALQALRAAVSVCDGADDLRRLAKLAAQLPSDAPFWRRRTRVGLLSSTMNGDRAALIRLFLAADRIGCDLYEGPYHRLEEEILEPDSGLHRFSPELVILGSDHRELLLAHRRGERLDLSSYVERWAALAERLHARHGCRVILHGAIVPTDGVVGNLDLSLRESYGQNLRLLNLAFSEKMPDYVTILDVEALAAEIGKRAWCDLRFLYQFGMATTAPARVLLARTEAAIIRGALGCEKRVLALDFDNTLWGGVIGEDGIEGIKIAQYKGGMLGQIFADFQYQLKLLHERGVLLVGVTKDNEEDARLPFERHPDMVLRLDDFAAVRASWRPKSESLVSIAEELGIELDRFVFVDDDPAERAEVRATLPDVEVIPLPDSPIGYPRALERGRWFEVPDLPQRRPAAAVPSVAAPASDAARYYAQLEMRAVISPFDAPSLPQIADLIEHSNQHNLTSVRYREQELAALVHAPGVHTRFLSLSDRYGDRGIVAAAVCREHPEGLEIESWVTTCRVLNRTVEEALLAHLVGIALARSLPRLIGLYRPTPRNGAAAKHYARLGFSPGSSRDDGMVSWTLPVTAALPPTFIAVGA